MSKHPVLHGFGKWLAVNLVVIMIIWYPGPLQQFQFIKTLISNYGGTYYDFFFFWWFLIFLGTFLTLIVWPSMSKRSFLR